MLKLKEEEDDEVVNTFKVLVGYINGHQFQQCIGYIDKSIKDAEATRNHLNQMKTYVNREFDKSIGLQNSIEESLNHARRLRELL